MFNPKMGTKYASKFRVIFTELAKKNKMSLVSFLMKRLGMTNISYPLNSFQVKNRISSAGKEMVNVVPLAISELMLITIL